MYCRHCGAQIPDDSNYCGSCGKPQAAPAGGTDPAPVKPGGGKRKKLIIAAVAGVAVIAVIAALVFCIYEQARQRERERIAALWKEEIAAAAETSKAPEDPEPTELSGAGDIPAASDIPAADDIPAAGPVVLDSSALPDLQSFSGNRLSAHEGTGSSTSTKFWYEGKWDEEFWTEYVSLLQDYPFALREQKTGSNSSYYTFDYVGDAAVASFDCKSSSLKNSGGISLYVMVLHYGNVNAEYQITFADGLTYTDTGERTTRDLEDYNKISSSSQSSSSGKSQCSSCGGSGRCSNCGGTGKVLKWLPGTNTYVEQNCTSCYSPGKCRDCGGTGER